MSATVSVPSSQRWLPRLLSGRPHQVIGPPARPYLLRWFIIPPNNWCNIYWHRFIDSDDPVPHCHPWDLLSIMLRGSYFEADQHGRLHRHRAGIADCQHLRLPAAGHMLPTNASRAVNDALGRVLHLNDTRPISA